MDFNNMNNITMEEEPRYLSEGEIIYLPYGKELTPNDKQSSMDSQDGSDWSETLLKLKNSKHAAQFLLTDHQREVEHYHLTEKNQNQPRSHNSQFHLHQPDRNIKQSRTNV